MKYLTCHHAAVVTTLELPIPQPAPGEIVVRLVMCGICGTDTAKVFGDYPKPQKLGHEVVGLVHAVGLGVSRFAEGQRVALAHHAPDVTSHYAKRGSETMDPLFKRSNIEPGGFSEYILVPTLLVENTVVAIPNHVSNGRAIFMEPMACCLRALDRISLQAGDTCCVVGVGAVGMLFMPLLRDLGVKTLAVDMRQERIATAQQWGAVAGGVPGTDDLALRAKGVSEGRGVDVVVLTIVNAATLSLAIELVRDGGTIIIFGGKPGSSLDVPLWNVWLREINLITSYSATPKGLHRAMDILSGNGYDRLENLISHHLSLDQAQVAFELVQQGKASKVVLTHA